MGKTITSQNKVRWDSKCVTMHAQTLKNKSNKKFTSREKKVYEESLH